MVMAKSTALAPGEGAVYAPAPPPQADDVASARAWMYIELLRIADALGEGRQSQLRLDVTTVLPDRPVPGLVRYFAAGVAGTAQGSYEYNGSSWAKL